jgi:hypothetical protein
MWLNVRDYGAQGDGVADDSADIQEAIDDAIASNGRDAVYFPPGIYRCHTALVIEDAIGLRLVGGGSLPGSPVYYFLEYEGRDAGVALVWSGNLTDPLLKVLGSQACSLEGLAFVGATPQRYRFSDVNSGDPGQGKIRFNSSTFTSIG